MNDNFFRCRCFAAGQADQLWQKWLAAIAVNQLFRQRCRVKTPATVEPPDRQDDRVEVQTFGCEPVFKQQSPVVKRALVKKRRFRQLGQAIDQRLSGNIEIPLKVLEPGRSEKRFLDDKPGPVIADDVEGAVQ